MLELELAARFLGGKSDFAYANLPDSHMILLNIKGRFLMDTSSNSRFSWIKASRSRHFAFLAVLQPIRFGEAGLRSTWPSASALATAQLALRLCCWLNYSKKEIKGIFRGINGDCNDHWYLNGHYWLNGFFFNFNLPILSVMLLADRSVCYYYFYTREQQLRADNELEVAKRCQADRKKRLLYLAS